MRTFMTIVLIVIMSLGHPGAMTACFWDRDTIEMERQRFPGTLELITGKFLRHSHEFYKWRVEDRLEKLKAVPGHLPHYDDLAVAYDKLGQHDLAIETILKKDNIKPGQYETHANLGTFLIHDGQLEEGINHIDKAIEINPNAHFGREIYQKLLVEYVISKRGEDGKITVPLVKYDPAALNKRDAYSREYRRSGFAEFVLKKREIDGDSATSIELQKALKGVLGMMRFGNYDSPILLEALGDLLLKQKVKGGDAKRMAARAYLRASYAMEDEEAKQDYRDLAESALIWLPGKGRFDKLEIAFRKELREADQWYALIQRDEKAWIERGVDVDHEFKQKYYKDPELSKSR